jgi:hypothetical protein
MEYSHTFNKEDIIKASLRFSDIRTREKKDGTVVGVSGTQIKRRYYKIEYNGETLYTPKNLFDDMLEEILNHFNLLIKE